MAFVAELSTPASAQSRDGGVANLHSASEAHLYRCPTEFDFRYNNRAALGATDAMRTTAAIEGVVGKGLTYRQPYRRTLNRLTKRRNKRGIVRK